MALTGGGYSGIGPEVVIDRPNGYAGGWCWGFKIGKGITGEWRRPLVHLWLGHVHLSAGWVHRSRMEFRRCRWCRQWLPGIRRG